jgi:hypothetical protein
MPFLPCRQPPTPDILELFQNIAFFFGWSVATLKIVKHLVNHVHHVLLVPPSQFFTAAPKCLPPVNPWMAISHTMVSIAPNLSISAVKSSLAKCLFSLYCNKSFASHCKLFFYFSIFLFCAFQLVHFPVIIIGAGVVGCALARELSKYQLRVLLLDKDDDVAQGASKANSGIIHGGYNSRHGTLKAKLGLRGNRLFPKLNKELNFGIRDTGSLVLAFNDEERAILDKEKKNGELNGVHNLRIVERDELLTMEPHLNPRVVAALYCPEAYVVSPYEVTIAFAESAVMNGVDLRLRHEVFDVQKLDDGLFRVTTRIRKFEGR